MSSSDLSSLRALAARSPYAPASSQASRSPVRPPGGNCVRTAVLIASAAVLCVFAGRADGQTTYTCSSATPSTNCALSIPGGTTSGTSPAALSSSTLTVTGATGPVASVRIVLNGVTTSTAGTSHAGPYQSLCYTAFVLEDPAGRKLALIGATGNDSCTDVMNGTAITIQDGATAAPDGSLPTGWPSSGSTTVKPSSYWNTFGISPLYDSSSADLPQTDGTAALAKFSGESADGTWTLHVADSDPLIDQPSYITDPVSISGWQLILTYATLPATSTTISSSLNPSYTSTPNNSTTLTASVTSGSGGVNGGTVSFTANGSPISCSGGSQVVSGGTATCVTSFSSEGKYSLGASYSGSSSFAGSNSGNSVNQLVMNHTTNPSGNTYCNTGNLSTTGSTLTNPVYPSYIQVPNSVTQSVGGVSVTLTGLQSTDGGSPTPQGAVNSTSFMLVSPGETHNLDFLSHVGTSQAESAVTVNIADGSSLASGSSQLVSGTYGPTDDGHAADSFITQANSPAPPAPNYPLPFGAGNAETLGQAFNGAAAAGNWLLFVENDSGIPLSVSGGWCIDLTLNTGAATTTSVSSTNPHGTTGQSVTITATVTSGGGPVTTGTVTFFDNSVGASLGSPVALNGSGQAAYISSAFSEGDHKITATYNGTASFNTSFGTIWQREDDATAIAAVNDTTWQYCNMGLVAGPAGASGAFTPNPSNIFVTNFPGTLNSVTADLNQFSISEQQIPPQTAALIESPSGAALDFFSNTGDSISTAAQGNYIFTDSAAGQVPNNVDTIAAGSYKPTSYQPTYASQDAFISSQSGFYNAPSTFSTAAPKGAATFATTFSSGSNPDGTWSLFFNQNTAGTFASGATQGWCVQLVENPPVVTVLVPSTDTFAQGQQGASFTVTVNNTGPGSTNDPTLGSDPMTVTDTLNSAFTYASSSGTGWSCSAASQTVTCTNHGSIADGNEYPQLTINVNVGGSASGTVNNSVTARGAGVASTNSNTDSITIQVPSSIAINGAQTQSTQVGTAFGSLAVTVKDSGGAPIPNYSPVTFTASTAGTGATGTFSNSTGTVSVASNGSGVADPGTFTANLNGGSYTVSVTAGTATTSFTLTNAAITPTITWTPVTTIIAGDAGTNVLNASVNCTSCGTITYTASPGGSIASTSSLAVGSYTITATFNPGSNEYNTTSATSPLTVSGESVWIVDGAGGTSELAGNGAGIGSSAYPGANLAVAIDNAGNVWSAGTGSSLLVETSQVGTHPNTIASGTGGLNAPAGVAIDGSSQVWVTNGNSTLSLFTDAGAALSPSGGFTDPSLSTPAGVAIDLGGSVWVANSGNNTVTRILGAAAPAAPLATAAQNNTTGAKP
jgi:hypothetical protein